MDVLHRGEAVRRELGEDSGVMHWFWSRMMLGPTDGDPPCVCCCKHKLFSDGRGRGEAVRRELGEDSAGMLC